MVLQVLAVSGSLRKASTNSGLLREAIKLAPNNLVITEFNISQIPIYNEDLSTPQKPEIVLRAYEEVAKADGLLFAAPCYNFNLTPSLKNFIDWVSRDQTPLINKPLGYIHSGMALTNHIDKALKTTVEWVRMNVYQEKQFKVKASLENFDAEGNLINQAHRTNLKHYLQGYSIFLAELAEKNKERTQKFV